MKMFKLCSPYNVWKKSTLFLDVYIRSLPLKEERDRYKEQTNPSIYLNLTTTDGSPDEFLSGSRLENKPYFLVAPKEEKHDHECGVIPAADEADYTLLDDGRLKVNSCPPVSCYSHGRHCV